MRMSKRAAYNPETDWKVVIPWRDSRGKYREFVAYGRAKAVGDYPERALSLEIMEILHVVSAKLVRIHPEARLQTSDVRVYHPEIKAERDSW